jgi:RNA 3'-terminal phosphate cyclase
MIGIHLLRTGEVEANLLWLGAYLGSGGSVFRTMGLSLHSTTHLDILRRFLEISIHVEQEDNGNCLVRIG